MPVRSILKSALRVVIPLLFGFFVLWLLYRNMDLQQILTILRSGANHWVLAGSLVFGLFANIIRGLRWNILIQGLGENPKKTDAVLTTLGNYAVNMVFPRMGEVWRCLAMSRASGIGFSRLLGTLLVDRASDFVMVALLVAIASAQYLGFFTHFFSSHSTFALPPFFSSGWFYLGLLVAVALLLVFFLFARHSRPMQKAQQMLLNVWAGLRSIAYLQQKWLFVFYSVLLWAGYFCFFYTTFYAFPFTAQLGVSIGLVTFVMSSIAVAAPVQAGMGAWHFMVIYTLTAFNVTKPDAASFALIVHTIQTLWTTLCGVVAIGLLVGLKRLHSPSLANTTHP